MKNTEPSASEVVNCLNSVPIIEHQEYGHDPGDHIDYNAFSEAWQEITQDEYTQEFNRATAGEFKILSMARRPNHDRGRSKRAD